MSKRSTIIGFALLVLLLTAGAAQGLSGSNTVFSDDIVDGTIITSDIKTGAVSSSRILDNGVTGSDTNEASLSFPCNHSAGPSFAAIDASAVSTAYSTVPVLSFRNCAGQPVQAKRLGTGVICVNFPGSTQTRAVASPVIRAFTAVSDLPASGACGGPVAGTPGQFQVITSTSAAGDLSDIDFTILAF